MATVNFSVPDDVKARFNAVFKGRNKSRVIAELMERAIEEETRAARRAAAFDGILQRRARHPVVTAEQIQAARDEGRP